MTTVHPTEATGHTSHVASGTLPDMTPNRTPVNHRPHTYRVGWPLVVALILIAAVWVGGAIWSFAEQTALAEFKHFEIPQLLPLVIDGLAVAMAAVAWAASLDARAAVAARLGAALAVAGSAASNAVWAWERSAADPATVALAVAVPIAANVAFEVLLAEIRKQVQRFRGLPVPPQIPYPHWQRMWLSPWSTFWQWRRLVLKATDMTVAFAAAQGSGRGVGTAAAQGSGDGSDTLMLGFLRHPYPVSAARFRRVPARVSTPLGGTPTGPRQDPGRTGTETPTVGVSETPASVLDGTPGTVPSNGSGTVARHPDRTPAEPLGTPRVGKGSAPALTSGGTPAGTPSGTGPNTLGRDGADTPAEYPVDEVLIAVLRNPVRVPREADGTVPIKRAMRVLKIGRDRAIRVLKAQGLLREPLDETADDTPVEGTTSTPAGAPDGTVNGSRQHPDLAGVPS